MEWILKQDLFHYVPEQECFDTQGKPYTLKWVDKNSEEEKLEPNTVFLAMPPVESLQALVSYSMTKQVDKLGRPLVVGAHVVSRAQFYGVCVRDVYVKPPPELHREGFLAKVNKTMYGTQDASKVWQKTCMGTYKGTALRFVASTPRSSALTW
eukprot:6104249-Amphidinium_carterae.2